jgi:alkylhydroperoxidase/carboxymuconolactone decarboxylase family protein YurZ
MDRNPLDTIKEQDLEFFKRVLSDNEYAFKDGALPAKIKYLIAMVLDAAHGATGGVTALAREAMNHGATKEEIMEAVHIANYVSGVGSVYTASIGLGEVFKK